MGADGLLLLAWFKLFLFSVTPLLCGGQRFCMEWKFLGTTGLKAEGLTKGSLLCKRKKDHASKTAGRLITTHTRDTSTQAESGGAEATPASWFNISQP